MRRTMSLGAAASLLLAGPAFAATPAAEPTAPPVQTAERPAKPDLLLAQLLVIAPTPLLIGAASVTNSPWPLVAVPATFGLGHLYAGEPHRAAAFTIGGPLATGAGYLGGALVGYGMSRLMLPGDFNPNNPAPPIGTILVTGMFAAGGAAAGLVGTGIWAMNDVTAIVTERNRPPLGPYNGNAAP